MTQRIIKVIILIFILLPIQSYGQNASKGFQFLQQGKHSDAIEVFNKAIGKKKDILASKFGLALIYSDTTYKRYRYDRAYKHIEYVERRYVKLPDNEKAELKNEYRIDDISIGKLRLKILNDALAEAKKTGTIESINTYRLDFPNTEQSKEAILLENKLAFEIAKKENNPDALLEFIRKYPNATEVDSSKLLLESFEEEAFEYYTSEGELESILEFEKNFPYYKDSARLSEAKKLAEMAFRLEMNGAYYPNMEDLYLEYAKDAAPSDLAYVALIRSLTPFLESKQWTIAIERLYEFKKFFPNNHKIDTLISILNKPENEIIINSISDNINTRGHEYAPVITADGNTLYFCGRHREGNIGNEDIFVSKRDSTDWKKASLLNSINTPFGYEAPLAISADGNRMLLYMNSNIYFSNKTMTGGQFLVNFHPLMV
jgi:hypothetical protein